LAYHLNEMAQIDLRNMHQRHRALTEAIAGAYEEAASVCLSRHHNPPVTMTISDAGARSTALVNWLPPDSRAMAAWANTTDATEAGAYACVIATVEEVKGLFAVRRAETGTGADYYVGPEGAGAADLEDCLRLEVSGVDTGDENAVARRFAQKARQLQWGDSSLPALAGVIGFSAGFLQIGLVSLTARRVARALTADGSAWESA
jgi:hypothetical protein